MSTRDRKTVGDQKLKAALGARGMSLADLARASHLSYQTLKWAALLYAPPSETVRVATARVLGMQPEELWDLEHWNRGGLSKRGKGREDRIGGAA